MSHYTFTDEQGDPWHVGYDVAVGGYFAYMSEVYRFEVPDGLCGVEKWSAFYDRDERQFVCEWVDATAYSADHAAAGATVEELRARPDVGERLPPAVADKLVRDAARPAPSWGDDGDLPTLADLERAIAGHVSLPSDVRAHLAADEPRSPLAARASAIARVDQVQAAVRASFPQAATTATATRPGHDEQRPRRGTDPFRGRDVGRGE